MPTYSYGCSTCSKEVELERRITDQSDALCPTCLKPMRRQISRTSFVLKGYGWASSSYAKNNTK